MKQVIQNYKTGEITLVEVSPPICRPGGVLVRNVASAVSLGTERSIIDLGKKSLIGKARARPDLFKQALNKAKKEGFWKTFQEAMGRLDTPNPLGYSCAGIVEEVGAYVDEFSVGDRVACIGAGFASHAGN
jgi:NADPH:quinone reductase-like Zn-dependent oxidoreductase